MPTNQGRTLSEEEKEQFAYELALGYFDDDGLRMRFSMQPHAVEHYKQSPDIQRMVLMKQREIDESDAAMKIHARRAARVAIKDLVALVQDEDAPAKTRMEAGRQLREYATIVDKNALAAGNDVDGPIYIKTNLDLGAANGVYAVTAKEVDEQMSDRPATDVNSAPDAEEDFADLLGV